MAHDGVTFVPHLGDKCDSMGAHSLSHFLYLSPAPIEHLSPIWRTPLPPSGSSACQRRRQQPAQPPDRCTAAGRQHRWTTPLSAGHCRPTPHNPPVDPASTSTSAEPSHRDRSVPRPSPRPGHTAPTPGRRLDAPAGLGRAGTAFPSCRRSGKPRVFTHAHARRAGGDAIRRSRPEGGAADRSWPADHLALDLITWLRFSVAAEPSGHPCGGMNEASGPPAGDKCRRNESP